MAEKLDLTDPETTPNVTDWRVIRLTLDTVEPSITVELKSNTNKFFIWKYAVGAGVTVSDVNNAISFINQGNFAVNQGKSLQRWLLEKISQLGVKVGTVSGTPD